MSPSNLDAKLRNQMRSEIIKLREKIDTTFVYVTHDQVEAMTLGDRIVIMKDGVIRRTGRPQEVFNHPANLFVAGFIGTPQMNFFPGAKLTEDGGKYSVEILGHVLPLTDGQNEARGRGRRQHDRHRRGPARPSAVAARPGPTPRWTSAS